MQINGLPSRTSLNHEISASDFSYTALIVAESCIHFLEVSLGNEGIKTLGFP